MDRSITPIQIKQNNQKLIYDYIYKNRDVSQLDMAYALRLSRPTITSNLSSMEEEGLIRKGRQLNSSYVGRKPAAYSIVPDYRISMGVEILKEEVKMIAVNLYGEQIGLSVFPIPYENKEAYFKAVCKKILDFSSSLSFSSQQVLGVGFAMQALVSPDGQTITYGKILNCTGLSISSFSQYLPYPCTFVHDANSAAVAELWVSPKLQDAFYLSLSKHLGAALISKREILTGKHGHSSTIEHIQVEPGGKPCYCGKRGCMETVCSLSALLEKDETPEEFFGKLQKKDGPAAARWKTYLSNLAQAVNTLHLICDVDFILGGYIAPYLSAEDLAFLHDEIQQLTPFPEPRDFLLISKMPKHNISIGAALPYIQNFLNTFI